MAVNPREGFALNQIVQKKVGGTNPDPFLGHQIRIFVENQLGGGLNSQGRS